MAISRLVEVVFELFFGCKDKAFKRFAILSCDASLVKLRRNMSKSQKRKKRRHATLFTICKYWLAAYLGFT